MGASGGRAGATEAAAAPKLPAASRSCGISSTSRAATSGTVWTSTCPRRPRAGCRWSSGFTAGLVGGSKEGCPAVPLAAKGYAVASINYRLSQHAVFPAQIEDCKAAIRWLRANAAKYHLDPDHIGVWGASAGGHLVAMLGTTGGVKELEGTGGNLDQSSRVQCVVDWFGPTDLATMGTASGQAWLRR